MGGTDLPTGLWKFLYLALPVFSVQWEAALLILDGWGSVKILQRQPLKPILRRSSVFHGAEFSLGLVGWLQGRQRRV